MPQNNMGEYIAQLRKEKGLTQDQLAEKIFITRQAVSKWEQGKSFPDVESLKKLSETFKVPIESFLIHAYGVDSKLQDEKNLPQIYEPLEKNNSKEKKHEVSNNIFNNFTTNNIAFYIYNDFSKSYNKSKKQYKMLFIILIILILSFLFYIIISLYNSVKIYTVSGEKDSVAITDGLLIITRDKFYFQIGKVIYDDESSIKDLEIYYYDNNSNKITMYRTDSFDNTSVILRDFRGYNAYFDYKQLDSIFNSLAVDLKTDDGTLKTIKLTLVEEKVNKIISKTTKPEAVLETGSEKIETELEQFIKKIFKEHDDGYQLIKEYDDRKIVCDYLNETLTINIEEKNSFELWQLNTLNNYLSYQRYDNSNLVEDTTFSIENITNHNQQYYDNFNAILNDIIKSK